jgi:ketosteroid isomerase-like protein
MLIRKLIILSLLLVKLSFVTAQLRTNEIEEMIKAERSFIAMAKERSTAEAFETYLTPDAITSGPTGPQRGNNIFNKQPKQMWLYWNIAFSDISVAGDLGYNTGPYEFRSNRSDTARAVAWGQFNSIWRKQVDGRWKNIVDIGVRHNGPLVEPVIQLGIPSGYSQKMEQSDRAFDALRQVDEEFVSNYKSLGNNVYKRFSSDKAIVCRPGVLPLISEEDKKNFYAEPIVAMTSTFFDGGISISQDLGYVCGTSEFEKSGVEGNTKRIKATYLRVYKRQLDGNWKIVLDVLSYNR